MTRMETMENLGKPISLVMFLSILLHPYTYSPSAMHDKAVVVTDASSIMGEAIAYEYCKINTRIMLVANEQQALEKVSKKCKEFGALRVETMAGDIANGAFRKKLMEEVEQRMGGLDHLLMNHRTDLEPMGSVEAMGRVMEINFMSYVDLASRALPMLEKTKGKIGAVSSLVDRIPVGTLGTHSASGAALMAFLASLRQELYQRHSNVSTTHVSLGFTRTETEGNALGKYNIFFNNLWTSTLEDVAETVVIKVESRKSEISYPFLGQIHSAMHLMFPNLYETYLITPYLPKLA